MVAPLLASHRVISYPPRALWPDSGPPPAEPGSWTSLADDLLHAFDADDVKGLVAVGHSFGGVVSLVAASRRPERFRALCLLDPTMVLADRRSRIDRTGERGVAHHRLAERARERRDRFGSVEEAFAYWRPKPLFRDWSDETLWIYVRSMLRPLPGSSELTLAWPAAWEAYYYESFYFESWGDLERLDPRIPVLVIRGGTSDTFVKAAEDRFRALRPTAAFAEVVEYGHLFPAAAPAVTGRLITEWLLAL
jgi:pimeloyl-ACP methyl ester carboxylesterase